MAAVAYGTARQNGAAPSVPAPMASRLVLAAFPSAVAQAHRATLGSSADAHGPSPLANHGVQVYVCADASRIELPPAPPPWLTLGTPHAVGPGLACIVAHSQDNPRGERTADLVFTINGRRWPLRVVQQPGLLVQTQLVRVLNSPLTVDMEVAVTYLASLLNDIPVPR